VKSVAGHGRSAEAKTRGMRLAFRLRKAYGGQAGLGVRPRFVTFHLSPFTRLGSLALPSPTLHPWTLEPLAFHAG